MAGRSCHEDLFDKDSVQSTRNVYPLLPYGDDGNTRDTPLSSWDLPADSRYQKVSSYSVKRKRTKKATGRYVTGPVAVFLANLLKDEIILEKKKIKNKN